MAHVDGLRRNSHHGTRTYQQQVDLCHSRTSYLSRTVAANAAWILTVAIPWDPKEPYPCDICGDWHLRIKRSA